MGHIDEIGLIVHHIDDDGYLWFTRVGGWDPLILVGQRVALATRDGRRSPAWSARSRSTCCASEDRKKVPELRDLHIDIGAKRRRPGARAGADRRRRGDRRASRSSCPTGGWISRSMDNRLGCFVALEAARLVAEAGGAPGEVAAVAAAQEEITFGGARTTAYTLRPTRRSSSTSPTRPTRPASTRRRSAAPVRLGPG